MQGAALTMAVHGSGKSESLLDECDVTESHVANIVCCMQKYTFRAIRLAA